MVIDTSAIIVLLENEPEASAFAEAISGASRRLISAGTLFELSVVTLARRGTAGLARTDELIAGLSIVSLPFDQEQAIVARAAYVRFGKGRHPARLNMGDCFAYALAKVMDLPLLFKGNDFGLTDIARVSLG